MTTDQPTLAVTSGPESIWLSPVCDDSAHHGESRTWAAPAPDDTCECDTGGHAWVEYVRADLARTHSEPRPVAGLREALERARYKLGHVTIPAMDGDNLAVTLCSHFDDGEGEEDDNGWTEAATAGCDATLTAIHQVYVAALATHSPAPMAATLSPDPTSLEGGEGEHMVHIDDSIAFADQIAEQHRQRANVAEAAIRDALATLPQAGEQAQAYHFRLRGKLWPAVGYSSTDKGGRA